MKTLEKTGLFLMISCMITLLAMIYLQTKNKIEPVEITDTAIIELSVWNAILDFNLENPEIVFAQAKLESGNFNSKLFKENNNLFGMQRAYQRPNANIGRETFAKYECWKHSILDYAIWQSIYARGLTAEQYYEVLCKKYAEDKDYIEKLKKINHGRNI